MAVSISNAGDRSGETVEQASDKDDVSERKDWNAGLDQTQLRMEWLGRGIQGLWEEAVALP